MTNNKQIDLLEEMKSDWDLDYRNLKAESPQEIDRAQEALWEIREKWNQLDKTDQQKAEKIEQWIEQNQNYLNQFKEQNRLTKLVHYGQIFLYLVLPLSTLAGLLWIWVMLFSWDLTSLFPSVVSSTYGLATAVTIGLLFFLYFIVGILLHLNIPQSEDKFESIINTLARLFSPLLFIMFFSFIGFIIFIETDKGYALNREEAIYLALIYTYIYIFLYFAMYPELKKRIPFVLLFLPLVMGFVAFIMIILLNNLIILMFYKIYETKPLIFWVVITICVLLLLWQILSQKIKCWQKASLITVFITITVILIGSFLNLYLISAKIIKPPINTTRNHLSLQGPLLLTGLTQRPHQSQWYLISEHFFKDNQISSQSIQWQEMQALFSDKENQCTQYAHLQTNSVYGYLLWNGSPSKVLCPKSVDIGNKMNEKCLIINEKYLQPMPSHLIKADNTNQKE